eukprot:COSAG02_NODE_1645_length_11523_cov_10.783876_3_plen_72_part_00
MPILYSGVLSTVLYYIVRRQHSYGTQAVPRLRVWEVKIRSANFWSLWECNDGFFHGRGDTVLEWRQFRFLI